MLVTITTDASFSSTHNLGAFAFWITSELGRIKMAGPLDGLIANPNEAEARCICNAVFYLRKHSQWPDIEAIHINTDSMAFIQVVKHGGSRYAKSDSLISEIKLFKELTKKWKVTLAHVKAHRHTNTKRNWVNDWCDREAKKELGILIRSTQANRSAEAKPERPPIPAE